MTLPSFIVGGAPKCGTTTLADWLRGHPRVYMPPGMTEPHYFEKRFANGESWYRGLFAGAGDRVVGEKSTWYLGAAEAPARVQSLLPDVRMIFMLREPVDRAVSHYWFRIQRGVLPRETTFPQFLEQFPEMVDQGHYLRHLQLWEKSIPRDRTLVLLLEDIGAERRDATLRRVCDFIGIEASAAVASAEKSNRTSVRTNRRATRFLRSAWTPLYSMARKTSLKAPLAGLAGAARRALGDAPMSDDERRDAIPRETLAALAKEYEPGIAPLETYLGRDLSSWLRKAGAT